MYEEYQDLDRNYYIDGICATHLLVPSKMGWAVLSMPTSDTWSNSILTLTSEDASELKVLSFHGTSDENHKAVTNHIISMAYPENRLRSKRLRNARKCAEVKNCLGRRSVMYSDQAKERFEIFSPTEQNLIKSLIETADKREMLFPTKADNVLIKSCSGKGNEDTYELRDVPSGIRIYFQVNMKDEVLKIGGIATKADGVGPEQTADINRASEACRRMK